MKKFYLLITCLFFGLVLMSCDTLTSRVSSYTKEDLNGIWASEYETYSINTAAGTFDAGSYSYAGDNMVINFTGNDCGYIYIKYTRALCTTHSDFGNYVYTYDSDAPDVGRWYCIHFEALTDISVKLSGAYGAVSSTATLEEAKAEFTVENNYFAYHSALDSRVVRSVNPSLFFRVK